MITKSLLALSLVASTLIGATIPASALLVIIAAKPSPSSGVVNPDSMKPKASKDRVSSNPTPHPTYRGFRR